MESHIKIKATVPEMNDFFGRDGGVRYMEIKDKRYTEADLNAMSDAKYDSEKFIFSVVYRHMELDKPLTGFFTIAGLEKKMNGLRNAPAAEANAIIEKKPSVLEKLRQPLPPPAQDKKKNKDMEL